MWSRYVSKDHPNIPLINTVTWSRYVRQSPPVISSDPVSCLKLLTPGWSYNSLIRYQFYHELTRLYRYKSSIHCQLIIVISFFAITNNSTTTFELPTMTFSSTLEKLKRKCSIRKKNMTKRTTSAPHLFKDDNVPVVFTPVRTAPYTQKKCHRFRSTPNLPKEKKSVSFDTSNTPSSVDLSRQTSSFNLSRHASFNLSRNSSPNSSSNYNSLSGTSHSTLPGTSYFKRSFTRSGNSAKLPSTKPSPIRRSSLNLVVDTSSCELIQLDPLFLEDGNNDRCSSFAFCDDTCLVCSMIRPELRAPHFPGNLSPELLRTFFWSL